MLVEVMQIFTPKSDADLSIIENLFNFRVKSETVRGWINFKSQKSFARTILFRLVSAEPNKLPSRLCWTLKIIKFFKYRIIRALNVRKAQRSSFRLYKILFSIRILNEAIILSFEKPYQYSRFYFDI